MSSFTKAVSFSPIQSGLHKGKWRVDDSFEWYLDKEGGETIVVEAGFVFDGASVPSLLTAWFPRIHADYIQAAALHDWLLVEEREKFSRKEIDDIFKQALKVLDNPDSRVKMMYFGVSTFGKLKERQEYWKPLGEIYAN